jgi:hypothetical protein
MPDHLAVLVRSVSVTQNDVVLCVTSHLDPLNPGNDHDRIRLGDLLARGRERAATVWDRPQAGPLLDRLERVVSAVDLRNGGRGIVVIATPELASACLVPFPFTERVAIGAAATIASLRSVMDPDADMSAAGAWLDLSAHLRAHPSACARSVPAGDGS